MRVDDRFRIASLTKTFAATVVMQLVDEGRLSLDDTVERWLPGAVPNGAAITVRQLLGHQSGLVDYQNDPRVLAPYLAGDLDYFWSPRALLGVATSHPVDFEPGQGVSYSATGYVAIGLIVEAVTGNSMSREMRSRLFRPLGLRSTTYPNRGLIRTRHSHGYLNVPGQPLQDVTDISPSYYWTTGNIVSTVSDVARFYDALFGGRPGLAGAARRDGDHPPGRPRRAVGPRPVPRPALLRRLLRPRRRGTGLSLDRLREPRRHARRGRADQRHDLRGDAR